MVIPKFLKPGFTLHKATSQISYFIFDIGIAMLTGSEIEESKRNSIETSRFVDLTESFPPSEVKRTVERMGSVDLRGTTLFKTFKIKTKMF